MKLRRKVAALLMIGMMFACGEARRAAAQDTSHDAPPDLRMLMNLDLFEPRHNGAKGAPAASASPSNDSMLDQIRALDAMGYLGSHEGAKNDVPPAPRAAAEAPASAPPPSEPPGAPPSPDLSAPDETQVPASQPSDDVEGPQP